MPTGNFDEIMELARSLRDAFTRAGIDLSDEYYYEAFVEEIDVPQITEDELMAFLEGKRYSHMDI